MHILFYERLLQKKKTKTIEDQKIKQVEALKSLKSEEALKALKPEENEEL